MPSPQVKVYETQVIYTWFREESVGSVGANGSTCQVFPA